MTLEELEKRIRQLEEMEQRVRQMEDIAEIKDLHRGYLSYISNLEFEKALESFADDITVEIPDHPVQRGKEAVAEFFLKVIYQNVFRSKDGHFTCQPVVSVAGDQAKGHWMFYRLLPDSSPVPQKWIQGRYDCEYRKENGSWKFSQIKLSRPWPEFFKP